MDNDYWINKWQNSETRFHQSQYHPMLVKYGDKLTTGTILVPLCGKSLDMHFLVSKGHTVIGVELSPIACEDFFKEAGLEYTINSVADFSVFSSEKITLWCGDFFKLPQTVWDRVSGIYDRAALVALPEEIRKKYVLEITNRSKQSLEIILITFEYLKDSFQGPPFAVYEHEINEIYKAFTILKLHSEKEDKLPKDNPRFQSIGLTENIYWLQKK